MSSKTLTGILEWPERAEGRVRQVTDANRVLEKPDDPFVPASFGESLPLRNGLRVEVEVVDRLPRRRPRNGPRRPRPVVERFIEIEGMTPEEFASRKPFEELTSIDPQPRLTLEHPGCAPSCRLIDLFCPIGRGQRGLIVAPPKAGKTTLLKDIATGILVNHPDVFVIALLVDERPEEVTDFRRFLCGSVAQRDGQAPWDKRWRPDQVEVLASSNDHDIDKHIQVSLQTLERCKRMVENGQHVVVVLDSLTRLGRAFNRSNRHANSGRTMSGGIDSKALEVPKQIFGAARNTEEAGSLTIIATCLVDTGSRLDDVVYEEFKGTGNMELHLSRKLQERRTFPAVDIERSSTRREDLLLGPDLLQRVWLLRRMFVQMTSSQPAGAGMDPSVATEAILTRLEKSKNNIEFLENLTRDA